MIRSVSNSSVLDHAHLIILHVCPEAPGEERFDIFIRRFSIKSSENAGSTLVSLGGGLSSSRVGTSGGAFTKNLLESTFVISACA